MNSVVSNLKTAMELNESPLTLAFIIEKIMKPFQYTYNH
jgi:hypothetical protein